MKEIPNKRTKRNPADSETTVSDIMYLSKNPDTFEVDFSKGWKGKISDDKGNEQHHMFYQGNFRDAKVSKEKISGIMQGIGIVHIVADRAECEEIVERMVEILTEWSEITDIKAQIQYGAVIVGKIEKIKEKEWIQSSDVKKKICTLLRNIIRLNITEDLFSEQQICLLKQGCELLVCEEAGKENLLQLNRKFRKEKLMTMPAWE